MILKSLKIENIRSYETLELSFPKGSILLSGDIGSGKTTILLAIEFALFGLGPSQKGSSLLRNDKDAGKVVLRFEIDGKDIILERTLKRTNKSVSQDIATITINGERFEGSVTEIKSKVLRLLNYPIEFAKKTNLLYKFTVYTPQEEMKQIILEPGDIRLNTLRHVFGIDKYKRIEENSAILTSKLREKIRLNEGMIYDLEDKKELLEETKKGLEELKLTQEEIRKAYDASLKEKIEKEKDTLEVEEKINEKKSFENEKSKSNVLVYEKRQYVKTLENTKKGLTLQIEEARKLTFDPEEYTSINERTHFQEDKLEMLQKEYVDILSSIRTEETKKDETTKLKDKIFGLEKCPTCLQSVSAEYKNNIFGKTETEISSLRKRIEGFESRKSQVIEQINGTKSIINEYNKKKSELELNKIKHENLKEKESRIEEIDRQIQSINDDLIMLNKHITTLDKTILEFSVYDKIYQEKHKELDLAKKKESELAIKKAEINKEVQFMDERIRERSSEITNKENLKKKTEKIKELEYWISKKFIDLILFTEKQVMLTLKEEFSKLFSVWFSVLVSDTLSAKLDDDFTPVIEQQDYEIDYSYLSGGERTAIALAYRLSLNQVINSMLSHIKTRNLVILDEPTDGFSSQQLDKMRDVLNQLNVEQLILVSHEQKIEGFVDNIIKLTKEHGVTKIL